MNTLELRMEAREILLQLADNIQELTMDEYTQKIGLLSDATIGEHTRHIIELFQQLLSGFAAGTINYDERIRDQKLSNDIDYAAECIANIISSLCLENKELELISLYNQQKAVIATNYDRELMYNIEHCIHHQAIIKIGLLCLKKTVSDENFGVAKSTQLYKAKCVQ